MKWLWLGYNITDPRNNIVMSALKKIQFLYNAKGKKTDVVIPLGQYEQIMEELEDIRDVDQRRKERNKAKPFDSVKKRILSKRK
jgi:hypothetical protein